jgi:flagellar biosynthetic protein FliR
MQAFEPYIGHVIVAALVFARVSALVVIAPVFGTDSAPVQLKAGLAAIITLSLVPTVAAHAPQGTIDLWTFASLALQEVFVGALLGFAMNMLLWAVQFAGGLADIDIGFHTGTIFNSDLDVPSLVGNIQYMIAMLVFFLVNGHHFVLTTLAQSFAAVPMGTVTLSRLATDRVAGLGLFVFVSAVKLAAPVMLAMFLTSITLALLSRVVPQLNIFSLNLQLKSLLGMAMLVISLPLFIAVFKYLLGEMERDVAALVTLIGPNHG